MSVEKISIPEKSVTATAHSKLILVGEHAVVHGQPAIAVPFPIIGVEAIVEHVVGALSLDSELYKGPTDAAPPALAGIVSTIKRTMDILKLPYSDLLIRIKSTIPPGKGLGSSASVAIAIVRSLFSYSKKPYTNEQLLELANISETFAHGAPSGIDSLTITSPSPIWYERNQPIEYIEPAGDFNFVVADTGKMADTKASVGAVKQLLDLAPEKISRKIERIGDITHQVREALEKSSKHLLGRLLDEAQKELEAIGVSDTSLNRIIQCAKEEGALGAKLTGGGSGGCVIALAENELHAKQLGEKLKQIGAAAVWPFTLKSQNHDPS